ncbi:hypothetical protein FHR33_009164 [Nonomuraea dietziae]|uniref:Uncharacterized protein n=1 Tax=Nonomuraea dietziae TaxID=65515 RepID=A0A7W5VRN0_9ACTN|nr:hypothetical protein [Nonomuraea dietziae]
MVERSGSGRGAERSGGGTVRWWHGRGGGIRGERPDRERRGALNRKLSCGHRVQPAEPCLAWTRRRLRQARTTCHGRKRPRRPAHERGRPSVRPPVEGKDGWGSAREPDGLLIRPERDDRCACNGTARWSGHHRSGRSIRPRTGETTQVRDPMARAPTKWDGWWVRSWTGGGVAGFVHGWGSGSLVCPRSGLAGGFGGGLGEGSLGLCTGGGVVRWSVREVGWPVSSVVGWGRGRPVCARAGEWFAGPFTKVDSPLVRRREPGEGPPGRPRKGTAQGTAVRRRSRELGEGPPGPSTKGDGPRNGRSEAVARAGRRSARFVHDLGSGPMVGHERGRLPVRL